MTMATRWTHSAVTALACCAFSGWGQPQEGQDYASPDLGYSFRWFRDVSCWVGVFEVTNAQYRQFRPDHDSGEFRGHSLNGDSQPVVSLSYDDAVAFTDWLTQRERAAGRVSPELGFRLPTKKEWRVIERCDTATVPIFANPWGKAPAPPKDWNYNGTEGFADRPQQSNHNDGFPVSCPVEKSGRNRWGLHGVGGNVAEWVDDRSSRIRVFCGGSWSDPAQRCGYTAQQQPPHGGRAIGFRMVLFAE